MIEARDESEIDDGNALFCLQWITSYDPREVVRAIGRCPFVSAEEMEEMAARLSAVVGGLIRLANSPSV